MLQHMAIVIEHEVESNAGITTGLKCSYRWHLDTKQPSLKHRDAWKDSVALLSFLYAGLGSSRGPAPPPP
ncbi:hypothetical protein J1614_004446 [Plenodomus biglobosus]|nr:hypothetical protein J1614_004446 [Plenodomus biglobosus]